MDNIIYCNSDQHKYERYSADFYDGNYENNFDAIIASTGIEGDYINIGCIYSDIDKRQQNSILQLLYAVANIKALVSTSD